MVAFIADYPDDLPSAIIYPEASARPLFYLLDPAFGKLAEQRGVPKPLSFFFKVCTQDEDLGTALFYERYYGKDIVTIKENVQSEIDSLQSRLGSGRPDPGIKKEIKRRKDLIKGMNTDKVCLLRRVAQSRAEEIRRYVSAAGRPSEIAILDDVIFDGNCVSEIRKAFGDPRIPAYILVSPFNEDVLSELQPVRIGCLFEKCYQHYQDSGQVVFDWRKHDRSRATGVQKYTNPSNPYVEIRRKNRDVDSMARLRREMRELGKELALAL